MEESIDELVYPKKEIKQPFLAKGNGEEKYMLMICQKTNGAIGPLVVGHNSLPIILRISYYTDEEPEVRYRRTYQGLSFESASRFSRLVRRAYGLISIGKINEEAVIRYLDFRLLKPNNSCEN